MPRHVPLHEVSEVRKAVTAASAMRRQFRRADSKKGRHEAPPPYADPISKHDVNTRCRKRLRNISCGSRPCENAEARRRRRKRFP